MACVVVFEALGVGCLFGLRGGSGWLVEGRMACFGGLVDCFGGAVEDA